jgi:chorismate-pyruvate lyase
MVMHPAPIKPELATLVGLFYADRAELGVFEAVAPAAMPAYYQRLLAHQNHMTVTVEAYHNSHVDVEVLESHLRDDRYYSRKILLRRQSDGAVVQFGIVRLNFDYVSEQVRQQVESRRAPVGRILIQNNVLREVRLFQLWKVTPGPDLRALFNIPAGAVTYGRTAIIDCNHAPAVELLEIVTPEQAGE